MSTYVELTKLKKALGEGWINTSGTGVRLGESEFNFLVHKNFLYTVSGGGMLRHNMLLGMGHLLNRE